MELMRRQDMKTRYIKIIGKIPVTNNNKNASQCLEKDDVGKHLSGLGSTEIMLQYIKL